MWATLTRLHLDEVAAILADDIVKCIFFEWESKNSDLNFTEICSQESNW